MQHPNATIEKLLSILVNPKLASIDLSLERIIHLLEKLGNPYQRIPPVVHVAGTNGKGSLVATLTAILQAAGYRVHRYTSPHLVIFNERIMLANTMIDDAYLETLLTRIVDVTADYPVTYFEATTAAAFLAFAEIPADIVLLETGLGGRLDATNVIAQPLLTAITPISLDHMEYLGDHVAAIAAEKAAIIKHSIPCVSGKQTADAAQVIANAATRQHAALYAYGKEWSVDTNEAGFTLTLDGVSTHYPSPNLAGAHQIENAATAIVCVQLLKNITISQQHIEYGIAHVDWPARLQHITSGSLTALLPKNCELWLDGGHNPDAGIILGEWLSVQSKNVHLITAMIHGKDAEHFLLPLAKSIRSLTAIRVEHDPQFQNPEIIIAHAKALSIPNHLAHNIHSAIQGIVKKDDNAIILICGSLYLAGYILWQNSRAI